MSDEKKLPPFEIIDSRIEGGAYVTEFRIRMEWAPLEIHTKDGVIVVTPKKPTEEPKAEQPAKASEWRDLGIFYTEGCAKCGERLAYQRANIDGRRRVLSCRACGTLREWDLYAPESQNSTESDTPPAGDESAQAPTDTGPSKR